MTKAPEPSEASITIPPGATTAEISALLASGGQQKPRAVRRRSGVPIRPPAAPGPVAVLKDGGMCMAVPLVGKFGGGQRFLVDLLAWARVALLIGKEWALRDNARGGRYVVSERRKACAFAGKRDGSAAVLVLSRFLTGAAPDQVVTYRDGDPLNLTRRNLVLEDRREHWERSRVVPIDTTAALGA